MREYWGEGALVRTTLIGIGCWLAIATVFAGTTELTVDSSDPGQAPGTLGWAIEEANQVPHDVLVVIYFDPGLDGQSIAVGSEPLPAIERRLLHLDGSGVTNIILDGEQLSRVLTIDAPPPETNGGTIDIRITNVEFRNGHATDSGGCLKASLSASESSNEPSLWIESSRFIDCHVESQGTAAGGGMFFEGAVYNNVRVTDSVFEGNTVHSHDEEALIGGGGLALQGRRLLEIERTRFLDNAVTGGWVGRGGGLKTGRGGRVTLTRLDFQGNSANRGGGAYLGSTIGTEHHLENIAASGNSADFGSAFKFWGTGGGWITDTRIIMHNSIIADNHATHSGAVTLVGTRTVIGNTTWADNTAGAGPADFVVDSGADAWASIRVHNSVFSANAATGCGSTDEEPDFQVVSSGNNFAVDASCEFLEAEVHDDLMLAQGDHPTSGARLVYPAGSDSPLVGGGHSDPPGPYAHTCHTVDFLGRTRPLEGKEATCTAGAVEWPFEAPLFNDCFDKRGCPRWW